MKQITFATHNRYKVKEVNELLVGTFHATTLKEIGCVEDIAETSPTIQGNALQKARYVYEKYGVDVFAEDTGLEIEALGGEPGVYTARYAGEQKDDDANMNKVLRALKGNNNRKAQFRTVVALILNGKEQTFEGICRGTIASGKRGTQGFGYDPIFVPDGHTTSFAEMSAEQKNAISHRGIAIKKLMDFLLEVA